MAHLVSQDIKLSGGGFCNETTPLFCLLTKFYSIVMLALAFEAICNNFIVLPSCKMRSAEKISIRKLGI